MGYIRKQKKKSSRDYDRLLGPDFMIAILKIFRFPFSFSGTLGKIAPARMEA